VKRTECIVVGTGGVGSAVLYHLAKRGVKALGIDRFPPGHDRGSSHGASRIIRLAYMEHPDYVPLLRRAYELWEELGRRLGRPLYHETGLFYAGPANGETIPALIECAAQHDLPLEILSHKEQRRRFPGFLVPASMSMVFEQTAGYVEAEASVRAHAEEAQAHGAEIRIGETVRGWETDGSGVTVKTDRGSYSAERLVITPGAWARELLRGAGIEFELRRKELFWFDAANREYGADTGCLAFFFETPDGVFYGFPSIDGDGVKVAEHTGGEAVPDPLDLDRFPLPANRDRIDGFITRHLPGISRTLRRHDVCMYTMSRDEHFVVNRYPGQDNIFFAAGLSGHGFKFAPVLGEILSDLVLTGVTDRPIEFLRLGRPGLT
jgi:sarcosine oxidase